MCSEGIQKLLAWIGMLEPPQRSVVADTVHLRIMTAATVASATEPVSTPPVAHPVKPPFPPVPATDAVGIALAAIDAQFAAYAQCPHCQSRNLGQWDFANGLRRYKCRGRHIGSCRHSGVTSQNIKSARPRSHVLPSG